MRLPHSDWLLIAAAAGLLTLAYPPFTLIVPAFVCLVPTSLLILRGAQDGTTWRRHLHQGFWYGTITHGVLLHWLAGALWRYQPRAVALYLVAAIMFGGVNAVMFAAVGAVARRGPARLVLALPAGVVVLEWLASRVGPIGFPWHQLALTVTSVPVLVQAADIAGSGGLAFVIASVNVCLALAWWTRRSRSVALGHLEMAATTLFFLGVYGLYRLDTVPLEPGATVAVVQPNVGATEKWTRLGQDRVVQRTVSLAERAVQETRPQFVAWPETALPGPLRSHPEWSTRLTRLAHRSGATVVTGGVDLEPVGDAAPRRYNAVFAFDGSGGSTPSVVQRKRKLVPMVEAAPARALDLSLPTVGGFTVGRGLRAVDSPIGRFGTLICYELTFGDMARGLRREGAEVLVTLSNDAWFGQTAAPYQHFAHAILRAVENRVTVVRAANTGVSGIVDPLGRVLARTEPFVETYAAARVHRSFRVPLAAHLGGMVGPFALGLLLLMLVPVPAAAGRGVVERPLPQPAKGFSPAAPLMDYGLRCPRGCSLLVEHAHGVDASSLERRQKGSGKRRGQQQSRATQE